MMIDKMLRRQLVTALLLLLYYVTTGSTQANTQPQSQRNFDKGLIAKCEFEAFSLGSRIADVFNAPVGAQDWNERVYQDLIVENLGFAPWIKDGVQNSGGSTLTGSRAAEIAAKGGYVDRHIEDSPYKILNHKWVYFFGDSTTRQVWASYAAPFQGNSDFARNSKEWTRQYCNRQKQRKSHPGGKNNNPYFEDEGWGGPCGVNEVTCYVSGYGEDGLLSYDWKHFPYDDYDDYVWGESGPWGVKNKDRIPDILIVQVGTHTCWHGHPAGYYSKHLSQPNNTLIDGQFRDIEKLVLSVDSAIRGNNRSTMVLFMTSGATYVENSANLDECIVKQNRILSNVAHKYGYPVLERGELERRLMYKSIMSTDSPPLQADTHLPQPAQNIIATCLLKLMNCLNNTVASAADQFLGDQRRHAGASPARPQHTPP